MKLADIFLMAAVTAACLSGAIVLHHRMDEQFNQRREAMGCLPITNAEGDRGWDCHSAKYFKEPLSSRSPRHE